MFEQFNKYVDWKILGLFLSHPNTQYYANQLAKLLKISPSSASSTIKQLIENGVIIQEVKGNTRLYSLNNGNEVVRSLKRAYGVDLVFSLKPEEKFLTADPNILSLALYGSYASGTFDDESDIDFIVITTSDKQQFGKLIGELQKIVNKEVNVTVFKLSEWRLLALKKDSFYKNVASNNVLLYGAGLK